MDGVWIVPSPIWVFLKIEGKTPKMDGLQWKTLSKFMIWGVTSHYFWKATHIFSYFGSCIRPQDAANESFRLGIPSTRPRLKNMGDNFVILDPSHARHRWGHQNLGF